MTALSAVHLLAVNLCISVCRLSVSLCISICCLSVDPSLYLCLASYPSVRVHSLYTVIQMNAGSTGYASLNDRISVLVLYVRTYRSLCVYLVDFKLRCTGPIKHNTVNIICLHILFNFYAKIYIFITRGARYRVQI